MFFKACKGCGYFTSASSTCFSRIVNEPIRTFCKFLAPGHELSHDRLIGSERNLMIAVCFFQFAGKDIRPHDCHACSHP